MSNYVTTKGICYIIRNARPRQPIESLWTYCGLMVPFWLHVGIAPTSKSIDALSGLLKRHLATIVIARAQVKARSEALREAQRFATRQSSILTENSKV